MRDNCSVASVFRHLDCSQSFSQRTDLVEFDQDGVSDTFFDTFFQDLGVGYEQVVTNQLDFVAQNFGLVCETVPVRFVQTVFDGNDRILFGQFFQEVSEFFRGERFVAFASQNVFTVFVEFRSCAVHRQSDVFAQFITSSFNSFSDNSQSFSVGTQVRRIATFVTNSSVHAFRFQNFCQVMENFRTHADGFFHSFRANRLNHEFLDINVVVSVLTTVDDVHHRNRHRVFARSAVQFSDVLVQRHTFSSCSSFGVSQRYSQDCVRAEFGFVFGAVQVDHDLVNASLIFSIFANQRLSDRAVYRSNSFGYAFTQETGFVAIAQFQSFTGTSRST
ncbi:hypothetical protein ExPUPEC61_01809 [Escherichia coli]|nr:hypothetical protein HmCmsJML023_00917 [Escherichia coli]GDU50148.1 hypothetical protein ExPUPEC61_01809 [Escherichia coli]